MLWYFVILSLLPGSSKSNMATINYNSTGHYRFTFAPLYQTHSSLVHCAIICYHKTLCKAFDWNKNARMCRLFRGDNNKTPDVNFKAYMHPCIGCKRSFKGMEYAGCQSITASGRVCQRWDVRYPHIPHSYPVSNFADRSMNHNFCRQPAFDDSNPPWCYTTNPSIRWEACRIDWC